MYGTNSANWHIATVVIGGWNHHWISKWIIYCMCISGTSVNHRFYRRSRCRLWSLYSTLCHSKNGFPIFNWIYNRNPWKHLRKPRRRYSIQGRWKPCAPHLSQSFWYRIEHSIRNRTFRSLAHRPLWQKNNQFKQFTNKHLHPFYPSFKFRLLHLTPPHRKGHQYP